MLNSIDEETDKARKMWNILNNKYGFTGRTSFWVVYGGSPRRLVATSRSFSC